MREGLDAAEVLQVEIARLQARVDRMEAEAMDWFTLPPRLRTKENLRRKLREAHPVEIRRLMLIDEMAATRQSKAFRISAIVVGEGSRGWHSSHLDSDIYCPPGYEIVIRSDGDPKVVSVYMRRRR